MRAFQLVIMGAGALALTSCATFSRSDFCNAQPGQLFVGQKADAASGLAIRQATGTSEVRWVPPRTSTTADVVQDRITVAYDDAMNITSVTCG
jgi:hypothetical protein